MSAGCSTGINIQRQTVLMRPACGQWKDGRVENSSVDRYYYHSGTFICSKIPYSRSKRPIKHTRCWQEEYKAPPTNSPAREISPKQPKTKTVIAQSILLLMLFCLVRESSSDEFNTLLPSTEWA